MASHTISADYLTKLVNLRYWSAAFTSILVFIVAYANSGSLISSTAFACVLGFTIYHLKNRHTKGIVEWAKNHSAEIINGTLVLRDLGVSSTISLDAINKIYLNKRRGKIKSIVLERSNGIKERLPHYSDLNRLVEEITNYRGKEIVVQKNWIHI